MTVYTTAPFVKKTTPKAWEESPFVYGGRLFKAGFQRKWTATDGMAIIISQYDDEKNVFWEVGRIPWDRMLGCILVDGDRVYAFGTTNTANPGNSLKIREINPATWTFAGEERNVVTAPQGVKIYNSSACKAPGRFVVVYETDEGPVPFSGRFLQSTDLVTWQPIGALLRGNAYNACQTVRYATDGWFLLTWLWLNNHEGRNYWITNIARTKDFVNVQSFAGNAELPVTTQVLSPMDSPYEGVNNSDCDFIEYKGRVYFTYFTGDQATWAFNNDAWYDGTIEDFYREWWPAT